MTDQAQYLNSLPQSHWDAWYADERKWNRLLDEATALGMNACDAADYAAERMRR